jgi:type 1 glutamine amidotransferase
VTAVASNLILCGGIFHDFAATSRELARLLEPLAVRSRIEADLERGLAGLADEPVDLLTVNALRWEMAGEKYDPYREREALRLSPAARRALESHVAGGGALLGLHTASICFSDWPGWGDILGGAWRWGSSWHPAPETVTATPTGHALMRGLEDFEVRDELYHDLDLRPGIVTLLEGSSPSGQGAQPVLWLYEYGDGRVVYDSLGHDVSSLRQPGHREALRRAVAWALGSGAQYAVA